ncbi:MAG TPA: DUF302 domain-containing protein [Actinomycetota bacterium]|nr:DUF302 domain-containing protein [Actinomycetota bacterium]
MTEYGYSVEVPEGYDEAVVRARLALKAHGFSILSEMHVGGLLGPEAGSERQYLFMGVWNSAVSQRRLDQELQVAVHLPCNVVVQETGPAAMVAALDPADSVEVPAGAGVSAAEILEEARGALARVLGAVAEPAGG